MDNSDLGRVAKAGGLWRWWKLAAIICASVIGLGGAYVSYAYDVPRFLVAISGLLFAVGITSTVVLAAFLWIVVSEDVRPALRFRRPVVRISLSHDEVGFVGERRFRQHPVTFWGGLILNNRFFVGFMLFAPPEHLTFTDPTPSSEPRLSTLGDGE
jgi:hypothetical protein